MVRGPAKPIRALGSANDEVAEHGEAGGDAAGGGVGQQADEKSAGVVEAGEGGAGLGHLHEREGRLLHAGAARATDDQQRQAFVGGGFDRAGDLLAHHASHGAHHERRIHDGQHDAAGP